MVLGVGLMLMLSVTTSTVLSFVRRTLEARRLMAGFPWQTVDFLVSFVLIAFMFAMLYKFVPDVDLGWRDVAAGALITAMLFTIGKSLIGLYLGSSGLRSVYGAAGSLVILLVWIYYSAQVFFLGAEITQAWVRRYGSGLDRAG